MDIIFKRTKDRDTCNSEKLLKKRFKGNKKRAGMVRARLDELADAETLGVMRTIPQAHCHELKGNRTGQLAVKLDKGYRMIFEVAEEPVPLKPDGGLDWTQVTAVRIIELAEDYHD